MRAHPGSAYTHLPTDNATVALNAWEGGGHWKVRIVLGWGGAGSQKVARGGKGQHVSVKSLAAAMFMGQLPEPCVTVQHQVHDVQRTTEGHGAAMEGLQIIGEEDCRQTVGISYSEGMQHTQTGPGNTIGPRAFFDCLARSLRWFRGRRSSRLPVLHKAMQVKLVYTSWCLQAANKGAEAPT